MLNIYKEDSGSSSDCNWSGDTGPETGKIIVKVWTRSTPRSILRRFVCAAIKDQREDRKFIDIFTVQTRTCAPSAQLSPFMPHKANDCSLLKEIFFRQFLCASFLPGESICHDPRHVHVCVEHKRSFIASAAENRDSFRAVRLIN